MKPDTWIWDLLPIVLPAGWRVVEKRADGLHYAQTFTGLSLIVSGATEADERRWVHMSVAHPSRLPTWTELVDVKEMFVGRERSAIQVIPPRSQYVNEHPFCLHLFVCIDGNPLPDFTRGTGSL